MEAKLENWYVTGLRQQNIVPSLVASIGDSKSSLLTIAFETNPEDSTADQSLVVKSQPVEIKYDAVSNEFRNNFRRSCYVSILLILNLISNVFV